MSSNKDGPLIVGKRDAVDFGTLLGDYRAGKFTSRLEDADPVRRSAKGLQSETVVLLEDLRSTAFIARAEKLSIDVDRYTLDILIVGYPPTSLEEFQLLVNGEAKTVSLNATADEFKEQTGVTGDVTMGAQVISGAESEFRLSPGRWRVSWNAGETLRSVPVDADSIVAGEAGTDWFVRVEQTITVGTGNLCEVIQTIPTGWDTPLRAGSICEVIRGRGTYWKVIGAEARLWNSVGTSGVEP